MFLAESFQTRSLKHRLSLTHSVLTTANRLKLGIPVSDLDEEEAEGDDVDDEQ